jgi:hypothetical protein
MGRAAARKWSCGTLTSISNGHLLSDIALDPHYLVSGDTTARREFQFQFEFAVSLSEFETQNRFGFPVWVAVAV